MKKIFKYCSFVILTILFFSLYNNIEANDIKIHGSVVNKGIDFQTKIGAYFGTVDLWNSNGITLDGSKIYVYDQKKYVDSKDYSKHKYIKPYGDDIITSNFTDGTVRSYSYLIHNKKLSNYTSGKTYGYTNDYDNINKKIFTNISTVNYSVNTIEVPRFSYGYSIVKKGKSDINVQYNHFPKEYVKLLLDNLSKYKAGNDGEGTYFYISEPIALKYSDYTIRSEERNVYDSGKSIKKNVGLLRASDVASYKGIYGNPINKNMPQDFGLDGVEYAASTSFINYYDNKLYLPQSLFTNHKVYVRHIDADSGQSIGKNENEILQSGGTKSIKSNAGLPKGDKAAKKGFSEYYEINSGETLYVSRLLNLVQNGYYYKVDSVTKSTENTYDDALKNEKNAKANKNDSVSVTAGDNSKVTVITFKYSKVPTNPDPNDDDNKPKGGVDTVDADGISDNCQMSYTPTNEKIKPYLVANKVKFLNLKYEYVIENNEIKYKSKIFNVEKLVSGNISDNDKYSNNVGKIFGKLEDKETLLEGKSPQTFTVSNNIDEDLDKLEKVEGLPTVNYLNDIAKKKTTKDDSSTYYKVPQNRYNGLRIPKLTANYQEYNVLNNNTGKIESTDVNNTIKVLVYNPIKVGSVSVTSEGVVDHSTTDQKNSAVIQKNANFDLNIGEVAGEPYIGHTYNEYLDKYYLIFDISIVKTDNTEYAGLYRVVGENLEPMNVGVTGEIPRGTIIELNKNQQTFSAKAGQTNSSDKISQNASQITLIGSSNNMPGDWLKSYVLRLEKNNLLNSEMVKNYISNETNSSYKLGTDINGSSTDVKLDYCEGGIDYTKYKVHDSYAYDGKDMFGDAYYFAKNTKSITNIGRIYDFKVTDCSDIDYKKVFRKTTGNNVNSLTGVEYFSGIKKFSIFSSDVNTLEDRENVKSVSSSSKTILPLGPYKNTDTSYVNAPKMGYRISFDLKTSGYYNYTESNAKNSKRVIKITPSYYYISKDGQKYNSINIDLYYKNSDGKYIKFVGSDYTIYFKPKDGYRTKNNSTTTPDNEFMSEQLEPLKIGSSEGFTLDYKMMNTSNDNFIQSWYGEFKLPNSTIVTENGNVSKPLTDGYVGVKFNIECIDTDSSSKVKTISYNTNNKNASPNTNTSQWDYEGYLGFSNPGSAAGDIALQLEKGTWTVNDNNSEPKAKYTDIKGTVALFDLDNRAANDFD